MFMLNKQTMKKDAKRQDAYSYLRIQTAAYLINQLRETLVEMKPIIQEHERRGGTVESFFREEIRKKDEEFLLHPYSDYSNN